MSPAEYTLSVRFQSKETVERLKQIAVEKERSLNYIINKACEEYIARRKQS